MPDGDNFDRHGRMRWKTASRKLFERDPTFEMSAMWSIKRMFRDGNMSALSDLSGLLVDAFDLRAHGIDCRVFVQRRLREIERQHSDLDSQSAIGIARDMLANATLASEIERTPAVQHQGLLGCDLVARLAVENCCMPALVHALEHEGKLSSERLRVIKEHGLRELRSSAELLRLVEHQLQQGATEIEFHPIVAPRPRKNVDQEALVHSASAFAD